MATIPPVEVPVVFAPCPDLKKLRFATELLSRLYLQQRSPRKNDFQIIHDACLEVEKLEAVQAVGEQTEVRCHTCGRLFLVSPVEGSESMPWCPHCFAEAGTCQAR